MPKKIIANSKEETYGFAAGVLKELEGVNVILLEGELGAGKTAFAQGLLAAAGAEGPFTSPTFVIMKKYEIKKNVKKQGGESININGDNNFASIYHLDCYRVGSQDVLELGWQEILGNPRNLVIVEWPEKIADVLPSRYWKIKLEIVGENKRLISLTLK